MNNKAISITNVILLAMTFIGLKNHVTILSPLLAHSGRDGWLSVILSSLVTLLWVFLLLYIHKKTKQEDIKQWLESRLGKVPATIFHLFIACFFILLAAFTMRETIQWINGIFLMKTPIFVLLIIYAVLCLLLALSSFRTILITNAFVLFGVIIFGFFVAIVNIKVKDYNLLLPFMENGIQPVLKGMIYPASGMIEVIFFLYLQQSIKVRFRFRHYLIMIGILTMLTLGPLIGAITEFGPEEAIKQLFPAYEEWGLVHIGRFIEHLDFLSIYQWLTGTFIRVGIILYFAIHLFPFKNKKKKTWFLVAPIFILTCMLLLSLEDYIFVKLESEYFLPVTLIFFFFVSLFYGLLSLRADKTRRTDS